jgi:hypothetical protein
MLDSAAPNGLLKFLCTEIQYELSDGRLARR